MAWDSKGWHEFSRLMVIRWPEAGINHCSVCGYHRDLHMSKLDYVSMRLEGKRTGFQFGFTGWKDGQLVPRQRSSGAIQPGTDIQAVAPQGEE